MESESKGQQKDRKKKRKKREGKKGKKERKERKKGHVTGRRAASQTRQTPHRGPPRRSSGCCTAARYRQPVPRYRSKFHVIDSHKRQI
eukprot:2973617-Rhodomonas_salina.1